MDDEYVTVVFKCDRQSKVRTSILEAFKDDRRYGDAEITAVSLEDEITRLEQFENGEGSTFES